MWAYGQKLTHTHTSNDSYEHPPRSEFELVVSSNALTYVLITPLQCIDCHPLVVDLGPLPGATDSAAPSLLELQTLYFIIPFMLFDYPRCIHEWCCDLYLLRRVCQLPHIRYITRYC
jgi:hypothetical protein